MSHTFPWQRAAAGANLLGADGRLGVTIFEEITVLAARAGAINLGQGFPDEEGPRWMAESASAAVLEGKNQYAPGGGIPELRAAISAHQRTFYGLAPDPETEVVVSTGATESIAAAVLAFVEPGDEVLTFEPFYDSYGAMIALAGGQHRTVALRVPDFQPDLGELASAVTDRTKMIILNTPHNPTGAVFGPEVLRHIVELAVRHDCIIVSDEVYEHLTFGVQHVPIATLPGAWDRTLTISSAGKTFSYTGWKVGWTTGPAPLVSAMRTVKQFLSYSSGPAFQPAVATALEQPPSAFAPLADALRSKRDLLASGLEEAGMTVHRPAGTYFVIADVRPLGFDNAADLARRLPEMVGVAGIPVSAFCHSDGARRNRSLLRFAFCKRTAVLEEAAVRLSRLGGRLADRSRGGVG